MRGNFGALHAQGEHCDQCNVCGSPQESPASCHQIQTTWTSSTGVLLQHDNARPHTARSTVATIQDLSFECLPHPPYSPDLAASDFHVFGPLKEVIGGKSFRLDKEVQQAVHKWLHPQPKDFFSRGIHALLKHWNICMERNGDYVEK